MRSSFSCYNHFVHKFAKSAKKERPDFMLSLIFIVVVLDLVLACLAYSIYARQTKRTSLMLHNLSTLIRQIDKNVKPVVTQKTKIFLIGESKMAQGENLIYAVTRPEQYDADVKTWKLVASIAGITVKIVEKPIEISALLFAIKKGTVGVAFAVTFIDAAGNESQPYITETFDVIDNIAPAAPAGLTITVREEIDGDDESAELVTEPEVTPEPEEEENEEITDGGETEVDNGSEESDETHDSEPESEDEIVE
jgi:hypothetical protein